MGDLVPASSTTGKQRHAASLWKPGQSGNPGGRPRTPHDLSALAREHTKEAVERLVQIMRAEDDGRALAAVQQLLDRGWGRPITPIVDETEGTSLTLLHLIAARRVGEVLQAAMEGKAETETGDTKSATIDYTQPALE
jgi:hypothetical protein